MIDCNMSWPPELEPSNGICPLVSVAQVTASKVATANVLEVKRATLKRGRWMDQESLSRYNTIQN